MRIASRLTRLEAQVQPLGESEEARWTRLVDAVWNVLQDREWHNDKTLHDTVFEPLGFAWHEFSPVLHHWAEAHLLDSRQSHCNDARGTDYRLPAYGAEQGASWCQRWSIDISNGQIFHTKRLLDQGITPFNAIDRAALVETARLLRLRRSRPVWGPGPYRDMSPHEATILRLAAQWEEALCE